MPHPPRPAPLLDRATIDPGKPLIEFKDVRMGFDEGDVLRGVSFTVLPGETKVFLGESGSGKTLIMKLAAGLMLAAMCDLIVAADDAVFSNPVLRLTGAGVELLVEPWELGIRKAKEFLLTGDTIDAQEAWRLGLVNRVVPRVELEARTRELADRIALVPPVTAQTVKDSLNQTGTLMGKRDALKYHFMAHHWVHNTATALDALAARKAKGSMREVMAERDKGHPE